MHLKKVVVLKQRKLLILLRNGRVFYCFTCPTQLAEKHKMEF